MESFNTGSDNNQILLEQFPHLLRNFKDRYEAGHQVEQKYFRSYLHLKFIAIAKFCLAILSILQPQLDYL